MRREADMQNAVRAAVLSNGAAACGAVGRTLLESVMTSAQRAKMERLLPGWRAVICAAFPYYVNLPAARGTISRYAWGMDYHLVIARRLEPAARLLRESGADAAVLVDASPVPERAAALYAGVGMLGDHGLIIVPPYGSYVFLGTVATTSPVWDGLAEKPADFARCTHCGACRRACPSGALGEDGFRAERCLSAISQKKGGLSDAERTLLRENHCLWGCDVCQEACPYNRTPRETELPEFREGLTQAITRDMLEGLSGRAFQRRFGNRAFAWRGVGVLRRNLDILDGRFEDKPVT